MKLAVFGFNHKTTSVSTREHWRVDPSALPSFLQGFLRIPGINGVVYLATCNRVELYVSVDEAFSLPLTMTYWTDFLNPKPAPINPAYVHQNEEALDHLIRVATGLDSLALGETQVLGQIKQAYQQSLKLKATDPFSNFVFQSAFRTAKRIRTETGITKHPTSVSSVAIFLAEQIYGDFKNLTSLILGLGEMGTQTVHLLMKKGIGQLIVMNRTHAKAKDFAKKIGAKDSPLEKLEEVLPLADLVITQTSSEKPILSKKLFLTPAFLKRESPTVLIDLGVPRDVEPEAAGLPNIFLYNMDDLKTVADNNLAARKKEALLAEKMLKEAVTSIITEWEKKVFRIHPLSCGWSIA